ncbi:MAG: glycosyltransferase family 39 protein [Deltaproteobacteria bacterium]|nr:glycosyltransferase family 39 protein [Deltaproteobacteria bacterium]
MALQHLAFKLQAAASEISIKQTGLLLAILVAGAVLRVALWRWFDGLPIRIWDEKEYNLLATNLVERGEYVYLPGRATSLRPPLYPAVVAGLYWLFGVENFPAIRFFQMGLSLLNVILLYRLGSEVFSCQTGLWLAGLFCFYPSMLGFNNLLLTEVLFTFLLCAACYTVVLFFNRESIRYLFLAGGLLGLASLTRSVLWLFPLILSGFLLLAPRAGIYRRLVGTILLVLAFSLTVAPWSIRNTRLEKTFITIDTMGGRNFMMGNYEYTPLYRAWDAISLEGNQAWHRVLASADSAFPGMTQGQKDKRALQYGMRFVLDHPWVTLKRDLVKFIQFWGLERELIAGAGRGYFGKLPAPAMVLLTCIIFGSYTIAIISGVVGIVMAPPSDKRIHGFFLLVIAFVWAAHTLVFAHPRYHLPVIPLVLGYSANALTHAREIWRRRDRWSFWLAIGWSCLFVLAWVWEIAVVDFDRYVNVVAASR